MHRRHLLRLLSGLIGGGAMLSACTPAPGSLSSTSATTAPAVSPTVGSSGGSALVKSVVFGGTSPANLNPLLVGSERSVTDLIFEALVKPDPATGTALPNLAQSWDTSPDGRTWSFHLQPNVTWSDGQPFTAEDVKFTFDVALGPTPGIAVRSAFDNVADYDVTDPHTFRVTLKEPECPFLVNAMLTPILPGHLLSSSKDIAQDEFSRTHPVGTGPFMLKEWVEGDHLTLASNPSHWQGSPKIDQWIHRPINGQNGAVDKLKFAFTLIVGSGNVARAAVAVIAQDAWKKLGIETQILTLQDTALNSKYLAPGPKDFDAILLGASIGPTVDPDQTQLLASSQYPNGGNFMHYSNALVDQLLAQARAVSGCDQAQRKVLYTELEQQLAADQPFTISARRRSA